MNGVARVRGLRIVGRASARPEARELSAIRSALARRGARERMVLTLLLYERLRPQEVAGALGLSLRQVDRTYATLLSEVRRTLARRRVVRPTAMRKAA
jgi:DNA-directed RNA polymerase specialized sigma24 family protein